MPVHGGQNLVRHHAVDGVKHQVGVNGAAAVADQQGEVVHLPGFPRLQHNPHLSAGAVANQMVVQPRHRQQGRDGGLFGADPAIAEDNQANALGNGGIRRRKDVLHGRQQPRLTGLGGKQHGQGNGGKALVTRPLQLRQLLVGDDRGLQVDQVATLGLGVEQVTLTADGGLRRGNDGFSNRVNGGVSDLGK